MKEASFYEKKDIPKVQCNLCPHNCILKDKQWGICKVRQVQNGKLYDRGYGRVSSLAIDPVEKKPLYHFYPGAQILSVGGLGCNFNCQFCQNHQISQIQHDILARADRYSPDEVVDLALKKNPKAGIAFTYNEPMINYDFMVDVAKMAKSHKIPTVVVSNGYINAKPLDELLKVIDAFNIDLKGFNQEFYKKFAGGKLSPVLSALQQIKHAGRHLEVTHLVVTGANDNFEEYKSMVDWVAVNLGMDTPFHISRYYPQYNYTQPATELSLINDYVETAREKLQFVYPGNVHADASTYCPKCGALLINRSGYNAKTVAISGKYCLNCQYELPIII